LVVYFDPKPDRTENAQPYIQLKLINWKICAQQMVMRASVLMKSDVAASSFVASDSTWTPAPPC
jgi:hypothetical protein